MVLFEALFESVYQEYETPLGRKPLEAYVSLIACLRSR